MRSSDMLVCTWSTDWLMAPAPTLPNLVCTTRSLLLLAPVLLPLLPLLLLAAVLTPVIVMLLDSLCCSDQPMNAPLRCWCARRSPAPDPWVWVLLRPLPTTRWDCRRMCTRDTQVYRSIWLLVWLLPMLARTDGLSQYSYTLQFLHMRLRCMYPAG